MTVTTRRGFQKLEWQKLRERNEVLDCRVYARAAAWIAGADRWSGAKWRGLEDQLGLAPGQTDGNRAANEPAPVTAGMLARAPRATATGNRRSAWLAVEKGCSSDLGRERDCRVFGVPLRSGTRVSYHCPEDDILRRSRRDRAPYTIWRDQGLLMATEGNTTDFKFIEAARSCATYEGCRWSSSPQ